MHRVVGVRRLCRAVVAILAILRLSVDAPAQGEPSDLRAAYDVEAYRIELLVDPGRQVLHGTVAMEAKVVGESLDRLVLDSHRKLQVLALLRVETDLEAEFLEGARPLAWTQQGHQLHAELDPPLAQGDTLRVAVQYRGRPVVKDDFTGFHFSITPEGKPWIGSSCQTIGSHTWWPCKSSFFHPEDKPARVRLDVTVPEDLVAAANGRLLGVDREGGLATWRWQHDYPLPTYAVAVAIGPYEILEDEFELPGCEAPVPVRYYILPGDVEKARLEFAIVEELLHFYSDKFGPYPFPEAKFALAQTPFWGMEHSTVISYGNSFPTWLAQNGGEDIFAERNRLYDYILIHETAHEWWGNAISAASWGDFWLHEGFATYAEALWVEHRYGMEQYLDFVQSSKRAISPTDSLYRPQHDTAEDAYTEVLYDKGSYVLHMLRYVMRDVDAEDPAQQDAAFFAALREFGSSERFRYGTARTRDFQRVCEKHHGGRLRDFFQPWLYGVGWPHYTVEVDLAETTATVNIETRTPSLFPFKMPLDVDLHCNDGSVHRQRHTVGEGSTRLVLTAPKAVVKVEFPGFRWILCDVDFLP